VARARPEHDDLHIIRTTDADHRPYTALCTGGSTSACGSVAKGLTQCSANLCSYTDSVAKNTASYTVQDSPPTCRVCTSGPPLRAVGRNSWCLWQRTVDALTISGANATKWPAHRLRHRNPESFRISLDRSVEPSGALGTWITSRFDERRHFRQRY